MIDRPHERLHNIGLSQPTESGDRESLTFDTFVIQVSGEFGHDLGAADYNQRTDCGFANIRKRVLQTHQDKINFTFAAEPAKGGKGCRSHLSMGIGGELL